MECAPGSERSAPPCPWSSAAVIRLLIHLRYLAVVGQALAVLIASRYLEIALPLAPMYIAIAALLAFNLGAHALYRAGLATGPMALIVHLCVDLGVLTVLLYFSGGPANPFVSLYLVPVALAAISLRIGAMIAKTLLAVALYSFLMVRHVPLPHTHASDFDLHVFGMWLNFLLCAGIMAIVMRRFMVIVREQRRALAETRERAMRDEALLAVGTLAAGTAHELNTPLTTMNLLVEGMSEREPPDREDLNTLKTQLARCREHVRTLAELARGGALGEPRERAFGEFVRECIERWQLLRPGVAVREAICPEAGRAPLRVDPTLPQALINLLDNAADASAASDAGIEVEVAAVENAGTIRIYDRGPGPRGGPVTGGGLGIGLLISNASIERAGGRVRQFPRPDGGCVTEVWLPVGSSA